MKRGVNMTKGIYILNIFSVGILLLFLAVSTGAEEAKAIRVSSPVKAKVHATYGKLPLSFEANEGQTDDRVKFLSRGSGYTLFLTSNDAVLVLSRPRIDGKSAFKGRAKPVEPAEVQRAVLRMKLVGSNPVAQVKGQNKLPGKRNYFVGSDPEKWRTDIPTYARVQYKNIYPGVDLVYYGNQKKLEYDFVVAPGADPGVIKLNFTGAQKVALDDEGNLILRITGGEIIQHKPLIYQEIGGVKKTVQGGYTLRGEHEVGFKIAAYNKSAPLIIDPILAFSTYLGGSGFEDATGIAVDLSGSAYVTGRTGSADFPTANPLQPVIGGSYDIFVSKLNASGSALVYSTYLGGSSADYAEGIGVDVSGNAVVAGSTQSVDFPTVNPLQAVYAGGSDTIVAKFNATGSSLIYSTYLGGSSWDYAWAVAVDDSGNAYTTGETSSSDFPTMNPFQPAKGGGDDIFVSKLNSTGSALVYSTFLGGSSFDFAYGIDADALGNAYVTGETGSINFPTANPLQPAGGGSRDAFVSKFNNTGSALVYSTYLGGSQSEKGWGIAADDSGNAYVTGYTTSTDFPTANPLQPTPGGGGDAFVSKLNSTGSVLVYSTYLGGSSMDGNDWGGIAADSSGNAYVTGSTISTDFPTANPLQPVIGGSYDIFVSRLNASGSELLYSTYLGGSLQDLGFDIDVTSSGVAYLTGRTISTDFPTVNPLQPSLGGTQDGFVAKIVDLVLEVPFDIEPQECPNIFNSNSSGVFPAAVVGAVDFDVATVDPASLRLVGVAPVFNDFKDVATPFVPYIGKQSEYDCTDAGADGFDDLRLKFNTQDVVAAIEAALGRPVQNGEVLILQLDGQLYDGTPIVGEDVIVIQR